MELWLTILHNTAKPHPTLLNLLAKLPPLLTIGSENLRTTIYILQAYVLLCPLRVMETIGPNVVMELTNQYNDLQDEGVLMILRQSYYRIFQNRKAIPFNDLVIE